METPESPAAPDSPESAEARAVRDRYARRVPADPRYSLMNPAALMAWQERQRAVTRLFNRMGLVDLPALRLLEVGSGSGGSLLELLRLGFAPENLAGIELLAERHEAARGALPAGVHLVRGDATEPPFADASFDLVWQSTVFSSLLEDAFQQRLADAMWRVVKPGGAIVWYDFTVDNPRNADVRGVPLQRVRALFPHGRIAHQRITLAPPIARAVVPLHPGLYTLFNAFPMLRTHLLCWIAKPGPTR